jgi:GTP cyclohydrolase IA
VTLSLDPRRDHITTAPSFRIANPRPRGPRVVRRPAEVDLPAAERAARDLITALGLDLAGEHLDRTPSRMVHALAEMTRSDDFELSTFPNDEGYDELVLVREIPVQSLCEHHLLPFIGVAHVGYLPDDRILGLSKFARMVEHHARRPQTQERLTQQIADHLDAELRPRGVGVVIEAAHTCMSLRGARVPGARTTTSALSGLMREDPRSRSEFLALARSTG